MVKNADRILPERERPESPPFSGSARSGWLRTYVAVATSLMLTLLGLANAQAAWAAGDDYPYKSAANCSAQWGAYAWCVDENGDGSYQESEIYSPWGFAYRNCTDWVAWRMRSANGVDFFNGMRGGRWGNANNWDANAQSLGYAVNNTPAAGAIAQTDAGSYGHVAWVKTVNGNGTVTIEEYNYAGLGSFNERTVSAPTFRYIHVSDLATGNPFGALDMVSSPGPGLVSVRGWAADPDDKDGPLAVHVYAGGKMIGDTTANRSRPDVPTAFPGYGSNLGYEATLVTNASGAVRVCAYAINVGSGNSNSELGCTTVNVIDPNPFGAFDSATAIAPGTVKVRGWMADRNDNDGPIVVHLYANGKYAGKLTANKSRPDVPKAIPGLGANLGFEGSVNLPVSGSVNLCAYGINVGTGWVNSEVGCKTVAVADPNPFGSLDSVVATAPGTVKVTGWMADPNDRNGPIVVHYYANGKYAGKLTANKDRPDVPKAVPGYGSNLGYSGTLKLPASGSVKLCAYGINVGAGWVNTEVGCKTTQVADPNPFGTLDSVKPIGGRKVTIRGWAADPNDKNGPVKVRLYSNGTYVKTVKADKKRRDVPIAHPGYGSRLGFSFTAKLPSTGTATVCVKAINKGAGWLNPQLGCAQVVVR